MKLFSSLLTTAYDRKAVFSFTDYDGEKSEQKKALVIPPEKVLTDRKISPYC